MLRKTPAFVLAVALALWGLAPGGVAPALAAGVQEFDAEIIPDECLTGVEGGVHVRCSTADSTYSEPLPGYAGGPSADPDPDPEPEPEPPVVTPPPVAPVCVTANKVKTVNIGNGVAGCACGGTQTTTYKETTCDGIVTATNIGPVTTTSCTVCAPPTPPPLAGCWAIIPAMGNQQYPQAFWYAAADAKASRIGFVNATPMVTPADAAKIAKSYPDPYKQPIC